MGVDQPLVSDLRDRTVNSNRCCTEVGWKGRCINWSRFMQGWIRVSVRHVWTGTDLVWATEVPNELREEDLSSRGSGALSE